MDILSEIIVSTYPKTFSLENGTPVTVRPLLKMDEAALLEYFGSLPGGSALPQGGRDRPQGHRELDL